MKTNMPAIFIVEDDSFYATMVRTHLESNDYRKITLFDNAREAIENLYKVPDIIILDYDLGDMKGIDVLKKIKSVNPNIQVIFLSGQENLEIAVSSLKYGAFDYLEKNDKAFERLLSILNRIEHHMGLVEEQDKYKVLKKVLIGAVTVTSILFFMLKDQLFQ